MSRAYTQKKSQQSSFVTVGNTVWIYPQSDVDTALKSTSYSYVYDGNFISCPDITNLIGVYTDIFNQTAISQPLGNQGYSIGVGSLLQDMGKELHFRIGNNIIITWRMVEQLTPQVPYNIINVPGNSPNTTIGYVTIYTSNKVQDINNNLDSVNLIRIF